MLRLSRLSSTKILTLIEISRLLMSLVTMLITAQFYPPHEYVVVVNVIAITTLFSGIASLGLPILLLTKPDQQKQKFAEAGFLLSFTAFGIPFIILECFSLSHHGVPLNKAFPLVVAEVLFAAVIQFNSRKLLGRQNISMLMALVGLSTGIRLVAYCFAAFTENYVVVYWTYAIAIIFLSIWSLSLSPIEAWKLRNQGKDAIKDSFALGVSSMLMTALDNLPTYFATTLLPPVNAATFALALRITSVTTIPGQSLSTAFLPRMKKHSHDKTLQVAIVGTVTSLVLMLMALVALSTDKLFPQYPSLAWYVLLFSPLAWARVFSISYGNILFIHDFARSRVKYIACGLIALVVAFLLSQGTPLTSQIKMMIYSCVLIEILIMLAIVLKALKILRDHPTEHIDQERDSNSSNSEIG